MKMMSLRISVSVVSCQLFGVATGFGIVEGIGYHERHEGEHSHVTGSVSTGVSSSLKTLSELAMLRSLAFTSCCPITSLNCITLQSGLECFLKVVQLL